MIARVGQLALQSIAKRRVTQQSGQVVHRGLLAHPPLVLDDARSGAESGEQFSKHDRLGQEVIDAGHHRVGQSLDLGVTQHQERVRVTLAALGKQLAALLHAQAVAVDDQEVGWRCLADGNGLPHFGDRIDVKTEGGQKPCQASEGLAVLRDHHQSERSGIHRDDAPFLAATGPQAEQPACLASAGGYLDRVR